MRALLLVNPEATSTTKAGRDVLAHALASELKLEVAHTRFRGHAAHLAARAAEDGFDLVVALGGDGTVNETVNGLLAKGAHAGVPWLAVVPGGSANVFARSLGIDPDPLEATYQLLNALAEGRTRTVGLARADNRWFTFNAGLGFDADVVSRVERHRSRGREASTARYVRTATATYLRRKPWRGPTITARLADGTVAGDLRSVIVTNSSTFTYLGNRAVRTNPNGSYDKGLGMFAVRSFGLPTVTRAISQMLRGVAGSGRNLLRYDDVDRVQVSASEPVNVQLDGDHLGRRSDVVFCAEPAALRVVA